MQRAVPNILFVSRDNSGRSQLAEACLQHLGQGLVRAYSCGVPRFCQGQPPDWIKLALSTVGIPSQGLRCKDWSEFTRNGAPRMNIVIAMDAPTYPDHPTWPGQPVQAVWDYPRFETLKPRYRDPAVAAVHLLHSLRRRIELLVCLQAKSASRVDLQHDLHDLSHL